jgi:hypothetical protein
MSEISNYSHNLQDFLNSLKDAYIEKLIYYEDLEPTFDKAGLPFDFKYCFSTTFVTDGGNFHLRTSMTTLSFETFWVDKIKSITTGTSEKSIHSKVKTVSTENIDGDFAYKLCIELGKGMLTIYAAEIYDDGDHKYKIRVNDEMIFVFDDELDAKKFEATKNYG